ncbi:hypothetical protein HOK51_07645 [Candidatus Woesearchaeota archaeon]|jgi:hypothetical protein|nr:hypothetical protein [Candidatus Woesearchaeota archaeon]MBT6519697.1 hypothetical protein [Candidatus Woesearchaeota archaeon]MBT7367388.1 hypothetical protein [Candidatus Woesearchaeota archaeon]
MNQTNLALKKLQGIKPKGIKFNEQSKLEHLIKTGNRIVADFSPKYKGNGGGSEMENLHFQIFSELKNNSLSNFKFDIADLTSFVHARSNSDGFENELVVLGLYSGALLSLLTKRNILLNKKTRVHINGEGNNFPYLFNYAQYVDEIIVENFKGKEVCSCISYGNFKANLIAFANMELGRSSSFIGSKNNPAKSVYFINNNFNNSNWPCAVGSDVWFIKGSLDLLDDYVGSAGPSNLWLLNNRDSFVNVKHYKSLENLFIVCHPNTDLHTVNLLPTRQDTYIKNFILCCNPENNVRFANLRVNNILMGSAANEKYKSIVELSHSLIGETDTLKIIEKSQQIKQLYEKLK